MITQILLNQLDGDNNRISYRRDWNKITGSVTASILLQQTYYWYRRNDFKPFYKFKEPPKKENKLYDLKKADDWCTELGFTAREFDGALNRIGFKFTSKTKNSKHSKFIEYWTDSRRVTYYKLNMCNFLDALLESYLNNNLSDSKSTKSGLAKLQNDIYENYKTDFSKSTKSGLPITDTTTDTTTDTKEKALNASSDALRSIEKGDEEKVFEAAKEKATSIIEKETSPPGSASPPLDFPESDEELKVVDIYSFDNFWNDYGYKKDVSRCRKKWKGLSKRHKTEIKRVLAWYVADTVKDDSENVGKVWRPRRKHPMTFLNGQTWLDYEDANGPKIGIAKIKTLATTRLKVEEYGATEVKVFKVPSA